MIEDQTPLAFVCSQNHSLNCELKQFDPRVLWYDMWSILKDLLTTMQHEYDCVAVISFLFSCISTKNIRRRSLKTANVLESLSGGK